MPFLLIRFVLIVLVAGFGPTRTWGFDPSAAPEAASGWQQRPMRSAKRHMVAAASPDAAVAGVEILRQGGSAADAAVAVQLVLNLVEPQSSGLGGGAFLVYWDAAREPLDAPGRGEGPPPPARPRRVLR